MTEPLVVDPSRLKAAGITLQDLTFLPPPPSTSLAGADSVSAAINETLPVIESPVLSGLPAVKAAVNRTGFSIVAAARIYVETDQTLGGHLDQAEFLAAGEKRAGRALTDQPVRAAGDQPAPDESPGTPEPALPVEQVPAQQDRIAELVRAMGPVAQNAQALMSTVQGASGGMGNTSASTAQTAEDAATVDQSPTDQAELVDETKKSDDDKGRQPGALSVGAAPGDQASETVPLQPTTDKPGTAPSRTIL